MTVGFVGGAILLACVFSGTDKLQAHGQGKVDGEGSSLSSHASRGR